MLSYNSCSLITRSLIFRLCTLSTDGALVRPGTTEQSLPGSVTSDADGCLWEGSDTNYKQTPAEHSSLACQGNTHFPHPITNQSIQHKDKTTSILLHNKAENKTRQKSHLPLGSAFKRCFAVWWKVPNCVYHNTALLGLRKFVKCKISLTSTSTL